MEREILANIDSVENLRPGAMEKLGIGYDVLSKANPRIILASTSGRRSSINDVPNAMLTCCTQATALAAPTELVQATT